MNVELPQNGHLREATREKIGIVALSDLTLLTSIRYDIDVLITLFRFHPYMILIVRNNIVISLSVLLADLEGRPK